MGYKVKYGGKRGKSVQLVESPDLVVIRTKGNQNIQEADLSQRSREIVEKSDEVLSFPEVGVSVLKVTDKKTSNQQTVEQRDEARTVLKQDEELRFAGRVLQDSKSGEVTLYTENLFVKFKDDVKEADCLAVLEKFDLQIKSKLPFAPNSYFVAAAEGTGLEVFDLAHEILKEKTVEYCHPELVQERRFKAIHPLQWHLMKTSIGTQEVDQHVNIEGAWKITKGKGVTIAVIDDGVEVDHPEFRGRIVYPYEASTNSFDARPIEADDRHGTACAGMACAAGLDGGASGTAPEAFLMPIRLRSGLGSMSEANAFAWAADHGADVISCSWGPADGEWWNPKDALHKRQTALPDSTRLALEYALTKGRNGKGCVVLFAAGNGNESIENDGYCSYPGIIAVAACNDTGKRSVYSDFGQSVWVSFPSGDFGWKNFKHPSPISSGLRTTDRLQKDGYTETDYTNIFGGTSGACPGMAGVVALMLAANPALTPPQVKNLIRQSCQIIDAENGQYDADGHSVLYGYGRIDAAKAVENAVKAGKGSAAPEISGRLRFVGAGEIALLAGGAITGQFIPPKKVLGLGLSLSQKDAALTIRYQVNISGTGILENKQPGEIIGTNNGRLRMLGFSIRLEGQNAAQWVVEYKAKLKDVAAPVVARNGAWCGTDKKTGKTIEGMAVKLVKAGG